MSDLHLYVHNCDRRSVDILYAILIGDDRPLPCHDHGVHVTTKILLDELEEELYYVS